MNVGTLVSYIEQKRNPTIHVRRLRDRLCSSFQRELVGLWERSHAIRAELGPTAPTISHADGCFVVSVDDLSDAFAVRMADQLAQRPTLHWVGFREVQFFIRNRQTVLRFPVNSPEGETP